MQKRTLRLLWALAGAFAVGVPSGARGAWEPVREEQPRGPGRVVSEELRVGGFEAVEISSAFEADIRQEPAQRVVVHVDAALRPYLRVGVSGGTLHVGLRPGFWGRPHGGRPRVEIAAPRLRQIELSGAAQALLRDLRARGSFDVQLSGASGLAGELSAAEVRVEASGASRVRLRGSCEALHLELSGASDAELTELEVDSLRADLSGASTAAVDVRGRLDLEASGASRLYFAGQPLMGSIELSGASSLRALGR